MSVLVVDVSELLGRPGAGRDFHRSVTLAALQGPLGGIGDDEPVQLDLSLDAVSDGIAVTGTVRGTLHLRCSRCLVDYDASFETAVDETFTQPGRDLGLGGRDEGDGYRMQAEQVDLEPMIRDLIVLDIPTVPLHAADCRGLCPTCGADRNLIDCGHTQKLEDLRWAPLAALQSALSSTGAPGTAAAGPEGAREPRRERDETRN